MDVNIEHVVAEVLSKIDPILKQRDLLLIETMVKIAAIQKIMIEKNILTDSSLQDEMNKISRNLVEQMKIIAPPSITNEIKN